MAKTSKAKVEKLAEKIADARAKEATEAMKNSAFAQGFIANIARTNPKAAEIMAKHIFLLFVQNPQISENDLELSVRRSIENITKAITERKAQNDGSNGNGSTD